MLAPMFSKPMSLTISNFKHKAKENVTKTALLSVNKTDLIQNIVKQLFFFLKRSQSLNQLLYRESSMNELTLRKSFDYSLQLVFKKKKKKKKINET